MGIEQNVSLLDSVFAGDDKAIVYHVLTGSPIKTTSRAEIGATTLVVRPLLEAISSGERVRFGNVVVTLSANSAIGTTTLTVTALTSVLERNEEGRKVQNLTGFTMEFKVLDIANTSLLTVSATITDALNGVCEVVLTDTQTETLTAGVYYYKLRRTNDGFEDTLAFGTFALRSR